MARDLTMEAKPDAASRMRSVPLAAVLTVAALLCVAARGSEPTTTRVEASRESMGCLYVVVAHGGDESRMRLVVEQALDEIDRVDRLLSHYKRDSALSALNRQAASGPVAVEAELFDLIARAVDHSRASDGAFDITVGPLMRAWGFFGGDGRVPDAITLAEARSQVGYRLVELDRDRRTIRFARDGVSLDLGGIGKGYAVDRAVALLAAQGIRAALVSAGGSSVYGLGAPPGAAGWSVDVQQPGDPGRIAFSVSLRDRALSIAGGSEKAFEADGVRYTHIMDPRTGRPVRGRSAVVVLSRDAETGDALDDALFVLDRRRGRALLCRHPGVEAFVAAEEGGVGSRFSQW
jgi:thiamine biosynthesis lipoprotein